MEWLNGNWLWVLLVGGMVGMHYFGHGRHGAGGGCCGGGHAHRHDKTSKADDSGTQGKLPASGERETAH